MLQTIMPQNAGVAQIHGAFSDLAGIGIEDYAKKWNNWGDISPVGDTTVYNNATCI